VNFILAATHNTGRIIAVCYSLSLDLKTVSEGLPDAVLDSRCRM